MKPPPPALQEEYKRKILKFDDVDKIEFVSSAQAYHRFKAQLDTDRDVLTDMPEDFLPPSIEVYPVRSLDSLTRIKRFSDYLQTLPGVLKVQYGRDWIERFYSFVQLMRIVVVLSGTLLIMTTTFTVAHTIRLTLVSRADELELLRLLGASATYIRMPYFLEGALQGLLGSTCGLAALYILFNWIKLQFTGSAMFGIFPFTFFQLPILITIIAISTLLCAAGSFSSTRKILQV
jgi:cell division transport system permease protein